jgi:heme-degrading monooxygenase HmoA
MTYHLAQLNIARRLYPLDDPRMIGFTSRLAEINALGEATPGFVWRLIDDSGNATDTRIYDDDALIVNLTLWESVEALHHYAYSTAHVEVFRQRRDWFEAVSEPMVVLWWVPAGGVPTVPEARERLDHLRANGPTPYALTFKSRFPPPG